MFYEKGLKHINIGTGKEITILELAKIISDQVGYKGKIEFDKKMPDGSPRKCMDVSLINKLGWKTKIGLKQGISKVYEIF